MRRSLVALLLALPLLGGCLDAFDRDGGGRGGGGAPEPADIGYDPEAVRITGVEMAEYTIPSFDETPLAAVVYAPMTADTLPDGSPPRWGVVVMLHGWGFFKEQFEGISGGTGAPEQADPAISQAPYGVNRLQAFAAQGLVAVAYDARGFGQSGGQSTIAGPAELGDLKAVLEFVASRYATNGLVGLIGQSYGAGQAFQAWADDPAITTIVPMYGWVDLFDGLLQDNVPKLGWGATLVGGGFAGSKGQASPLLAEWMQKAVTRTDLGTVEAQMDLRSAGDRIAAVAKPLLVCQGLQETLFPQADRAWEDAGGFTRALVFQGGHGTDDPACWAMALDWMLYFLAGRDTGVAAWPALTAVDAAGGEPLEYTAFPEPIPRSYYLVEPALEANPRDGVTFTVEQRLLGNPLQEPSSAWDLTGQSYNQVPEQFREDPTAVFFESAAVTGSEVLLGSPVLRLRLADPEAATAPYQVVGVLYHVDATGKSRILSHAAAAALDESDAPDGVLELRFWWTKADLAPGDRLVLKVGANDSSVWAPLLANYAVEFTGQSELVVPFFEG